MYRNSELLEYLIKKYKFKNGTMIGIDLLNKISTNENIKIKDLMCLLEIKNGIYSKLKNHKQKETKIRLGKYKRVLDKKIIDVEKINIDELYDIKENTSFNELELINNFGISRYRYNKMKNDKNYKVNIVDMKEKHKIDLMKIDFKFFEKYGDRYYKQEELSKQCKIRHTTLNDFALYYGKNYKHYKFNKIQLDESEKGFWIGENVSMPEDFIVQNFNIIESKIKKLAKRISFQYNCQEFYEDFIDEAMENLIKFGNIVKSFYFNKDLIFNILMIKEKFVMLHYYKKNKRNYIYLDSYDPKMISHLKYLSDSKYDPQNLM